MKYAIYTINLFIIICVSCLMSILGINMAEMDNSPLMSIAYCVVGLFSIITTVFSLVKSGKFGGKEFFFIVLLPVLLYLDGLLEEYNGCEHSIWFLKFRLFVAVCTPSICIACMLANERSFEKIVKWLDVVMLVITAGMIMILPQIKLGEGLWTMGGASYQSMSYSGAIAFGINIFFIINHSKIVTLPFFNSKIFLSIRYVLLVIQLLCVIISGGRGGVLLLIANCFVSLLIYGKIRMVILYLLVAVIFASTFDYIIQLFEFMDTFDKGPSRAFSYLSEGSIDMGNTSGRDQIYHIAISMIQDSPIVGHGLFASSIPFYGTSPHNFFLELLIQGGILYFLSFFLIVLLPVYKKMKLFIKESAENGAIIPIALYPMVMLLFSGSYIVTPTFMFVVVFLILYKPVR